MDAAFEQTIEKQFRRQARLPGPLQVAFANKNELAGSCVENTTREGLLAGDERLPVLADPLLSQPRGEADEREGGSIVTMTYLGSERVIPNYNTMGVAKAALEAATHATQPRATSEPRGIRVNAISAGAMRTLSLAGISEGRTMAAC